MGELLAQVIPLAVGAMISPVLLIVQVLTLTGREKPVARAIAIAAGSAVTLLAITAVLATAAAGIQVEHQTGPDPVGAAIRGVCALVLLALGARSLARRGSPQGDRGKRLANVKTRGYFVVGLLAMLSNVTSLVLYIPAMHLIVHANVDGGGKLAATAMLFAFTMLPLWLPLAMTLSLGSRSTAVLSRLNAVVTKHTEVINAVICFAFAAYLTYGAIKAL